MTTSANSESSLRTDLENALKSEEEQKFVYPDDLAEIDHWVAFRAHTQEFLRSSDFPVTNSDRKALIFLPMPASLGTQHSQNWASKEFGQFGAIGGDMASKFNSIDDLKNNFGKVMIDTVKKEGAEAVGATLLDNSTAVTATIAGLITNSAAIGGATAVANEMVTGALAQKGQAKNPYLSVMYESPALRVHSFSWTFKPKSKNESRVLREIIKAFKYHAAPSQSSFNKHFFKYPEMFDIDFHYSEYTFNIGPSVLTDLQIDYHAEGQALYHSIGEDDIDLIKSKAPVSVSINATFQETTVVTKETIEKHNR